MNEGTAALVPLDGARNGKRSPVQFGSALGTYEEAGGYVPIIVELPLPEWVRAKGALIEVAISMPNVEIDFTKSAG
jgi:hypothetical protein